MEPNATLFEALQREFCPPLDTSLLAAFVAEIELETKESGHLASPTQIATLRATLHELAVQAKELRENELADDQLTSETDDSNSMPDFYNGTTATTSSLSSDASDSSALSFSSPLGFLQAALPHVPMMTLQSALRNANPDSVDMWDVVSGILTQESIRELEERGLSALDDEESLSSLDLDDEAGWETIQRKKPGLSTFTPKISRKKNRRTITLVDMRQQQHTVASIKANSYSLPPPDPWTQLSSFSTHLASLLPRHPASFFQSFFHSPDYATPYKALRACLQTICKTGSPSTSNDHTGTLYLLLDILLPEYIGLDPEQRSHLMEDIELALQATEGRGDDALDLVKLLRELDADSVSGQLEMGVYHFSKLPAAAGSRHIAKLPTEPPPSPIPPQTRVRHKPPPPPKPKADPFEWQSVPQRKTGNQDPHPLANFIPAYNRDTNGKTKGSGNAFGKGGKGDVGELAEYRKRQRESIRKRDQLLREATRMWQQGNVRTRGGEAAFYFAEKAREFQELARKEALNAARALVESKRLTSNDRRTIDLHGTTVSEAIVIVKEILEDEPCSPSNPLKIITGRGTHSVNQTSVLKPALKKALHEARWSVGSWDGGLVVRGKDTGSS